MAELTSSTREAARRLGVSDTTMHKAERTGRITREPDGQWDIAKLRVQMRETADPQRTTLSGSTAAEGTPFARLKVAQLALKVEAQRLALDESKGRLLDVATANATIDEIASTMRDALLNWPARVAGVIAAEGDSGRHEGAYFGWWNFATKLNLALAAGLALPLLGALGYAPGTRGEDGLQVLALAYAVLPCALKLVAAGALYVFIVRPQAGSSAR